MGLNWDSGDINNNKENIFTEIIVYGILGEKAIYLRAEWKENTKVVPKVFTYVEFDRK